MYTNKEMGNSFHSISVWGAAAVQQLWPIKDILIRFSSGLILFALTDLLLSHMQLHISSPQSRKLEIATSTDELKCMPWPDVGNSM